MKIEMIPLRELEDGQEVKEKAGQKQRLIGLISKTDILNVAREREEFEKELRKYVLVAEHHSTRCRIAIICTPLLKRENLHSYCLEDRC